MKALRTWLLGMMGLLVFTSCSLFGPEKPYNQGDRQDHPPLELDQPHPEKRRAGDSEGHTVIDYMLPWRLVLSKD